MTIEQMRKAIFRVWRNASRVDRMPDHQVAAVYQRMLAAGEFKEKK